LPPGASEAPPQCCGSATPMAKRAVEEEAKSSAEGPEKKTPPPKLNTLVSLCVAAWLIPGFGHLLLRRRWRALILFVCITSLFLLGVAMKGDFFAATSGSVLKMLGHLGELCAGVVMPAATFFGYSGGDPFFVCSDYGTAYLIAAGMLNILAILDVYDIAVGRKD
jgi:Family of unknown function (DUF6677)